MMTQTKTPEWSGLAPAVDAHLSRWAMSSRDVETAARFYDTRHHTEFDRWARCPMGSQWTRFAMSYGVPDENGDPVHDIITYDGDTISGREQMSANSSGAIKGALLAVRENEMLSKAISHYVSADVVDEVNTASALANYEPLYETDLFCRDGFAVFEQAVAFPDLDQDSGMLSDQIEVHIRAIGWHRIEEVGIAGDTDNVLKPGVMVFLYTTRDDYENGYFRSMIEAGFDPNFAPDEVDYGFIPLEVISWQFGREWATRPRSAGHVVGTVPTVVGWQRRWFYTFMRFMWQQIVVTHPERLSRQVKRGWERDAKRKELLDYTTLRLRRVVDPLHSAALGTGTGTPLDHRMMVRPHWKYAYLPGTGLPARDASGAQIPESHRWVWVERHWRGDESLPIGAMDAATAVVR